MFLKLLGECISNYIRESSVEEQQPPSQSIRAQHESTACVQHLITHTCNPKQKDWNNFDVEWKDELPSRRLREGLYRMDAAKSAHIYTRVKLRFDPR